MPRHVLVADGVAHGHHPLWLRTVAQALSAVTTVSVLAPRSLAQAAYLDVEIHELPEHARAAGRLNAIRSAVAATGADHVMHLYGERSQLLRWVLARPLPVPASVFVFSPSVLHYPRAYGASLTFAERAEALGKEALVRAWRRRSDAVAVYTLDPAVTQRWNRSAGARAYTLPEPATSFTFSGAADAAYDCVIFGAIDRRKGLDLLTAAAQVAPAPVSVLLAGQIAPRDAAWVEAQVTALRATGASVTVHDRWISDAEVPAILASGRCVLLSYPRHKGTSRVLLEAAAVGTPAVAHEWGLLGSVVREHKLGLAVDCTRPRVLADALLQMRVAFERERFAAALHAFTRTHCDEAFSGALLAPFGGDIDSTLLPTAEVTS